MKDISARLLDNLEYRPVVRGRKDYGIGIVGAGRIALKRLVPAYGHAGLNVVAVADIRQEALDDASKQFGIGLGYLGHRWLLDADDIDIVDVCTNTFPDRDESAGRGCVCAAQQSDPLGASMPQIRIRRKP